MSLNSLREDAWAIWQAGLEAVRSDRLVRDWVRVSDDELRIGRDPDGTVRIERALLGHVVVVGAGKAGAGMAEGLETALGDAFLHEHHVTGWLNVPADCVRELSRIILHAARPAGVNEPTEAGAAGAERILQMVGGLSENDLVICLLSGGGSALLPSPVPGISLADKQQVTRLLSGAGANIEQLNTVRKQLSGIKGGGLARACRAGRLVTLIISDVLGDPLDVIASGPTVPDSSTPADALHVLEQFATDPSRVPSAVWNYLREAASHDAVRAMPACQVTNFVIGNNQVAVEAARAEAERLGYAATAHASTMLEGEAEQLGRDLLRRGLQMREAGRRAAFISGGEPTVRLADASVRGSGGRNQQLVLAALEESLRDSQLKIAHGQSNPLAGLAILSAGTDGEDGPTDAAGAVIDAEVVEPMRAAKLDPIDYLQRNDAYHFFGATGGLLKTGPTDTNVCDVRVVVTDGT
ncbi:MAG: DUF4147 domain-containing protein [Planctomycetales bacterium]|nr:DUF4147 domain-containing protein [Planctomycetales bacterium]